jgi:hypothetical protein
VSFSTADRDVMRQAVSFSGGSVVRQCEDGVLPDEVRGGVVLVQVSEHWRERFTRVQLHRGLRVLGIHVHHKVGVCHKERHLTFRIATISAVSVGLDKLPDSQAIRGLVEGDGNVFAHESMLSGSFRHGKTCPSRIAFGSRNALIPNVPT